MSDQKETPIEQHDQKSIKKKKKLDPKDSLTLGKYLTRNNDTGWFENNCFLSRWLFIPSIQISNMVRNAT